MVFDKRLYLDFQGLAKYDELIKEYIKSTTADSTDIALQQLTILGEKVSKNTQALEILNGTGDGSVAKTVNDAISALVDNAPETLDTLKELADWIAADETASAALIQRVNKNEENIVQLQQADINLQNYIDSQDEQVYDSIQNIADLKISTLFPFKQQDNMSVQEAIDSINQNDALELLPNQEIKDNIVISKSCYINANNSTFFEEVSMAPDKEIIIENANYNKVL